MNYKPMTEAELRQGDDGRLLSIAKFADGTFKGIFNIFPYAGYNITEDAFDEYKIFCDLSENFADGEYTVELYRAKKEI